jgi:O-antigen/teichoic acid export membrane protein
MLNPRPQFPSVDENNHVNIFPYPSIKFFKNIFSDDLARDAFVMFLGSSFLNFFNLVYSLFLLRSLSPVDFGLFNTMLSFLMFFSQFPSAIAFVIVRFISHYHAQEDSQKIKEIILFFGRKVLGIGTATCLLLIFIHAPLARFLKVPDGSVFFILGFTIFFVFLSVIPSAALQGLQRFSFLSAMNIIGGILKLMLVVVLVKIGLGVAGALWAFLVSSIIGFLFYIYFLRRAVSHAYSLNLASQNEKIELKEIRQYFFPVFLMTLVNASLLNVDVIMVKHFFSPLNAGFYSIAQVVGKAVFFFPSAIITVMFPKVAGLQAKNKDTKTVLKKSLLYMFVLSGAVAFVVVLFPEFILAVLAREVHPECVPLVRLFSLNMVILSMLFGFLNYYLSLNAKKSLYIFLIGIFIEIILISFFHQSLKQVLYMIFVCFLSLLVFNLFIVFKKSNSF